MHANAGKKQCTACGVVLPRGKTPTRLCADCRKLNKSLRQKKANAENKLKRTQRFCKSCNQCINENRLFFCRPCNEVRRKLQQRQKAKVQKVRRRLSAGVENTFTEDLWAGMLEYYNYQCAYCLAHLAPPTKDHFLALSKGGGHTEANIVPACQPCNTSKNSKSIFRWLAQQRKNTQGMLHGA